MTTATQEQGARKRIRVTNTTARDIVLPPVSGRRNLGPDGAPGRDWGALTIQPGGYNVDAEYLELIRGPKATKGARKAWTQYTTVQGKDDKPALLVSESPKALKAKEGPEAPKSLRAYGEEKAIVIVQATDDADVLREWLSGESRPGLVEAIEKRLREVK